MVSGLATDFVSVTETVYRRIRWRHVRQKESGHSLFEIKNKTKERKKPGRGGRGAWLSVWMDKGSEDGKISMISGTDGLQAQAHMKCFEEKFVGTASHLRF